MLFILQNLNDMCVWMMMMMMMIRCSPLTANHLGRRLSECHDECKSAKEAAEAARAEAAAGGGGGGGMTVPGGDYAAYAQTILNMTDLTEVSLGGWGGHQSRTRHSVIIT